MDILFAGNLSLVSKALFQKTGSEYRCVLYSENGETKIEGKNIISCRKTMEEDLTQIFASFDFEAVLFFSYALDGAQKAFGELEKLEQVLFLCRNHNVKKFIYIMNNHISAENRDWMKDQSRLILKDSCEAICRAYAEKGLAVELVQVPYLYTLTKSECQLFEWMTQADRQKKLVFPGHRDYQTDFLCDEDLGELLSRMLDETGAKGFHMMYISGGNRITFGELGDLFREYVKNLTIEYGMEDYCLPGMVQDSHARTEYGWSPMHLLTEDIREGMAARQEEKEKAPARYERRKHARELGERIRVLAELIVVFVLAELLNHWTRDNIMINFIDFRLIFVVIMGMMNGLNAGVAAAVLASAGYALNNMSRVPWQIVFYNVQNWLPFACYFLLGCISGYTSDKHDDETLYAKEEYEILEKKYIFLNGLYMKVLESKEIFNSQIIGYRDSFGKMYSVVKKLDTTLPEQVFYEAVNVLEEILGNSYVAIYSMDGRSPFARLSVCSRNCSGELGKSMRTEDFPKLMECLRENRTFVNKDALEHYPAYATPVFRNENLVGMILLLHADYKQMNMEFSNKFRIMTDLIRDSLIRAMDYYDNSGETLENTRILSSGKFREILAVKQQMKKKQYLEYTLLLIHQEGWNLQELNDKISTLVRNNDVLGMGEQGELYLLLSQTNAKDIEIVAERMEKQKISFEVVKEEIL